MILFEDITTRIGFLRWLNQADDAAGVFYLSTNSTAEQNLLITPASGVQVVIDAVYFSQNSAVAFDLLIKDASAGTTLFTWSVNAGITPVVPVDLRCGDGNRPVAICASAGAIWRLHLIAHLEKV